MSSRPLTELQAAVAAGFHRWSDFCRARESGVFPEPARELPGFGSIWTEQQIDRWLGVETSDVEAPPAVGSKAALEPDERMLQGSRTSSTKRPGVTAGVVPLPPGVPDDLILYTQQDAAKLLLISVKTLQNLRWKGRGPHAVKYGRSVLYRLSDLRAYLARDHTQ